MAHGLAMVPACLSRRSRHKPIPTQHRRQTTPATSIHPASETQSVSAAVTVTAGASFDRLGAAVNATGTRSPIGTTTWRRTCSHGSDETERQQRRANRGSARQPRRRERARPVQRRPPRGAPPVRCRPRGSTSSVCVHHSCSSMSCLTMRRCFSVSLLSLARCTSRLSGAPSKTRSRKSLTIAPITC